MMMEIVLPVELYHKLELMKAVTGKNTDQIVNYLVGKYLQEVNNTFEAVPGVKINEAKYCQ